MKQLIASVLFIVAGGCAVYAQPEISVSPKTVNVYGQGSTSYLITFGNLGSYRPAESTWCGELIAALPDLGLKCSPATIWGRLPARYDQARLSGVKAFTDIVSVSPSITRRAYLAAAAGQESIFYYVKRFIHTAGGPDQYVWVGCRMTGGGARVPFSLTDVRLSFGAQRTTDSEADPLVLFVAPGQKLPVVKAEITYTGTGRLKGRWEIVQPGDPLPEERDLLPEGALPIEERGKQRHYQDLGRFNVFLPPAGQFTLAGPDPARLPNQTAGQYLILLRIEATDDREADSDLAAVGAGAGVVHSGAIAGFPLPALRYAIGSENAQAGVLNAAQRFAQLLPREGATVLAKLPVDFVWEAVAQAAFYRLEIEDATGKPLLVAPQRAGVTNYRAPAWLKDKTSDGGLRWRVVALDQAGNTIAETGYRNLRLR